MGCVIIQVYCSVCIRVCLDVNIHHTHHIWAFDMRYVHCCIRRYVFQSTRIQIIDTNWHTNTPTHTHAVVCAYAYVWSRKPSCMDEINGNGAFAYNDAHVYDDARDMPAVFRHVCEFPERDKKLFLFTNSIYPCTFTHICAWCTCIFIYVWMYMSMYLCIYVHMYVCMYACMYTRTHMHNCAHACMHVHNYIDLIWNSYFIHVYT